MGSEERQCNKYDWKNGEGQIYRGLIGHTGKFILLDRMVSFKLIRRKILYPLRALGHDETKPCA